MAILLMTRPQGDSERFVTQMPDDLRAQITPIISPLIKIVPVSGMWHCDDAAGLIFTSSNAVKAASDMTAKRGHACYCVGKRTTEAAQKAGWNAEFCGENADTFLQAMHTTRPVTSLLHLRGSFSHTNLAGRLKALNIPTSEQVVYDQPLLPFNDVAIQALAGNTPVIAPIFSPRTARQFASLATGSAPLFLAALSETVLEPLNALKYNRLIVPERSDALAMTQAVKQLINDANTLEGTGSAA